MGVQSAGRVPPWLRTECVNVGFCHMAPEEMFASCLRNTRRDVEFGVPSRGRLGFFGVLLRQLVAYKPPIGAPT
jgi:hypothetical protein